MDYVLKCLALCHLITISPVASDIYNVKVRTEQHVNLVDTKFLSFTIDPKYLFSSSEKYNSNECICMASSLTPAYIRIAGPSTANMTFKNTTISINDTDLDDDDEKQSERRRFTRFREGLNSRRNFGALSVTHKQWEKFVRWAKSTGFDLVFALNNEEKISSGMWDPNTALNILTVADEADIGKIYWQLGYECTNQSIEEYLNDLETLRVIIETFPLGKSGKWLVVGGDVTHCLQEDSKSDFKDYVTLSNDMLDAILLNGNSSSRELERMSDKNRLKLLKVLSESTTPLWLTENNNISGELERAADWMTSLGYSARNGFSIHYRELMEKELYEPTLSFYMALLFKNLVGERVLSVDLDAPRAALFAHCTSLRHKPVPGAITLYGVNMDDEPARFSIKLSKTEEGGDIMQFILTNDYNGNIVVNGRAMFYEGDIRPVVKRIRPFKTLLINLPPKSFGFWVLANTQVEACREVNDEEKYDTREDKTEKNNENIVTLFKSKRSLKNNINNENVESFDEILNETKSLKNVEGKEAIKERINEINNDLKIIRKMINKNPVLSRDLLRSRRDMFNERRDDRNRQYKNNNLFAKIQIPIDNDGSNLFEKISHIRNSHLEWLRQSKERLLLRLRKENNNRRYKISSNHLNPRNYKYKTNKMKNKFKVRSNDNLIDQRTYGKNMSNTSKYKNTAIIRNRRSIDISKKYKNTDKDSFENEIKSTETFKEGKLIHKIKKRGDLPQKNVNKNNDYYEDSSEEIIFNTKVRGSSAILEVRDKAKAGLFKNTVQDVMSLLGDLNSHLNRFWNVITVLE